ncbi:MAG: hypothetical protein EBX68_05290, partial [Betaproteobacteria bacterium]|nr:hypothetical protein [Betaproteobacteria bacterium]
MMGSDALRGEAVPAGSAILRAISVIEAISTADAPPQLADICRAVNLPKPTVFRILSTLEHAGLVGREPGSKRYTSAGRLNRLAGQVLLNSPHSAARHAILEELVEQIGETCNLTIPNLNSVLYLDRVEVVWQLRLSLSTGSLVPLYACASGKLFLANMPKRSRERILRLAPMLPHTASTLCDYRLSGATIRDVWIFRKMTLTSDLLRGLNEQQHAAVTLPAQHALILAGAGSGKTRVLTTRIAWLIASAQVSPQGLLAVTFTNKAAREMLNRLSAMVAVNLKLMWVGTFHGLCNRMLRAHHRDAGLPASFQILDSQDQLAAIKRMLKAMQIDEDKVAPRNLMHFINACKESGQRAASVEAFDDYNRRFVELYSAYEVQCQREAVVDFAELLLRSYELLQRNQLLRDHYQLRFRHILVDEFQDTNALQYRWLKLLAGAGNAVFAVGDDDQSIYGFRGADVGNMMAFEREFRVDNLIKLEQNYRSAGHILDCANALIEQNNARLGKALWTDAGAGEPVRVQELVSDAGEAQWLVEQIKAIVRDGDRRSDVAVLYRSNAQSRVIEHALFSATIPYRVYGGLRFFERAEVKHALAYLRLIEQDDDDGAFLRVVNFPVRGIGARSLEQLQDLAKRRSCSLMAALAAGAESGLSTAALSRLRQF